MEAPDPIHPPIDNLVRKHSIIGGRPSDVASEQWPAYTLFRKLTRAVNSTDEVSRQRANRCIIPEEVLELPYNYPRAYQIGASTRTRLEQWFAGATNDVKAPELRQQLEVLRPSFFNSPEDDEEAGTKPRKPGLSWLSPNQLYHRSRQPIRRSQQPPQQQQQQQQQNQLESELVVEPQPESQDNSNSGNHNNNTDIDNTHENDFDEDAIDSNVSKSYEDNADDRRSSAEDADDGVGDDGDDGGDGGDNRYQDDEEQWLNEHFEQGIREIIDDQVQLVRHQWSQHYEQQLALYAHENQQLRQLLQQSRVPTSPTATRDTPRPRVPLPAYQGDSSRTGRIVCPFAILLKPSEG